jgi:hypothetical protein
VESGKSEFDKVRSGPDARPRMARIDKAAFLRQFPGALENVKLHGQGNWLYMREGLHHG